MFEMCSRLPHSWCTVWYRRTNLLYAESSRKRIKRQVIQLRHEQVMSPDPSFSFMFVHAYFHTALQGHCISVTNKSKACAHHRKSELFSWLQRYCASFIIQRQSGVCREQGNEGEVSSGGVIIHWLAKTNSNYRITTPLLACRVHVPSWWNELWHCSSLVYIARRKKVSPSSAIGHKNMARRPRTPQAWRKVIALVC